MSRVCKKRVCRLLSGGNVPLDQSDCEVVWSRRYRPCAEACCAESFCAKNHIRFLICYVIFILHFVCKAYLC